MLSNLVYYFCFGGLHSSGRSSVAPYEESLCELAQLRLLDLGRIGARRHREYVDGLHPNRHLELRDARRAIPGQRALVEPLARLYYQIGRAHV